MIRETRRIAMRIRFSLPARLALALLVAGLAGAAAAPESATPSGASPFAPGAKIKNLAGDFKFTEGPASDPEGNVYFTDQPNDRILKWSTDGQLSTFLQPAGRSNGLCFD